MIAVSRCNTPRANSSLFFQDISRFKVQNSNTNFASYRLCNFMKRFGVVSSEEERDLTKHNFSENTIKGANSAWKQFSSYLNTVDKEAKAFSKEELATLLVSYIPRARKENGDDYKSSSLETHIRSIVRKCFLLHNENSPVPLSPWNFDKESQWISARNSLSNVMKNLQTRQEDIPSKAVPLSVEEINAIFLHKIVAPDHPKGLQLRWYLTLALATAQREAWHVDLKWSTILEAKKNEKTTSAGLKYWEIPIFLDKNHKGGLKFSHSFHTIVQNTEDKSRCFMYLTELMIEKRPNSIKTPDRAYLRPNGSDSGNWYSNQPVGKTKISGWIGDIMKTVFSAQIMEEKKYTNHSLRATAATILFHAGFDEQLIAAITKHKSLAGLRSYKHVVPEQLAVALQTIHGNTNRSKEITTQSLSQSKKRVVSTTTWGNDDNDRPKKIQKVVEETEEILSQEEITKETTEINFDINTLLSSAKTIEGFKYTNGSFSLKIDKYESK